MTLRDFETFTLRDLRDPDIASQYLSLLLKRGELALLLGAGVSIGAGLPSWKDLVEGCERDAGLPSPSGRSTQELMRAIDTVRRTLAANDGEPLAQVVRRNLYQADDLHRGEYPRQIMSNQMLIAIGALVMASARGSIGDVFTLNFDDLLEWYLHLHGFSTQVVTNFPTYLRGDVDVAIFHPHGFLPLVEREYSPTDWMILSHTELVARLAASPDSPWPTLLGSRFLSKRFLAVGTSMNDLDIGVILQRAQVAFNGNGPLGFVVDVGVEEDAAAALLETGLVPVVLSDYDAIPEFLLGVCRNAAGNLS